nr:hypothetical protein [Ruegeria atlantica]
MCTGAGHQFKTQIELIQGRGQLRNHVDVAFGLCGAIGQHVGQFALTGHGFFTIGAVQADRQIGF